jgi:predicted HTH domain antitoxin
MSQTLTIEYPDLLPDSLNMSRSEFEREARVAMAAKLFEMGKLTSGQAARLAGMERVDFLYELRRIGVSTIQISADELTEDVANAQRAYDRHQQQSGN